MNNENIKIYKAAEICEYLNQQKPDREKQAHFLREGFRCLGAGERGMGGLSRTAKFIPESIHILLAPQSCLRHCDLDLKLNGYTQGVYSLFLTEQDIAGGQVVRVLWEEIIKILETSKPQPKVITITVTCIDSLMHSDYGGIKKMLEEKYGIRFGVIEMFPILADNKVKHTDKFVEAVYSLIHADPEKPKKKLINLLGSVDVVDTTTDFYTVLHAAGYEVREIRQCRTLEEFDEMGEACLNIVLSEFNLYAAKMMERKYHIPFFFWNECMNPDTIMANYKTLERILGCPLEVGKYYEAARQKAAEIEQLSRGKTFAVGQRLDYHPPKAACDLITLGLRINSVFVDKIQKSDLPYYEYLREHSPHTDICLAPDISMRTFMSHPEPVDAVIGGSILFLKNVRKLQTLKLSQEPYDFVTFTRVMEQMKAQLSPRIESAVQRQKAPKSSIFARQWKPFPKGVVQ